MLKVLLRYRNTDKKYPVTANALKEKRNPMFGYAAAEISELKLREYEIYKGYYCGLCRQTGKEYGPLPRAMLSYDFVFMALLLESQSCRRDELCRSHCLIHPLKKKPMIRNAALSYTADMMLLLGYENILDDKKDAVGTDKIKPVCQAALLKRAYHKAAGKYPEIASTIRSAILELSALEQERCPSPDKTSLLFADIMAAAFSGFAGNRVLTELSRRLGAWIYTVDAADDFFEDLADGSYNPFICEHGMRGKPGKNDLEMLAEEVSILLFHHLDEMKKAYDLLDIKKNKGILDNIIFFGMRRRTESIIAKFRETKNVE